MVDQEPRRRKKEKDPINLKAVDETIILMLAEPDPKDPTRRKYGEIDETLAEAVIERIDLSGLSDHQITFLRNRMTKRIVDAKTVALARLENYTFLSKDERKRMDEEFLARLRDLNPTRTFESPSDYAALFTQQLAVQKPQTHTNTIEYFDPTSPPRFDPSRPVQPGSLLDNVLGTSFPRYIGTPKTPAPERIPISPRPNNDRVMNSRS